MSNKRLIFTIGLLLGASQLNAMTYFKRFSPALISAAALAQAPVVRSADEIDSIRSANFTMSTLPDRFDGTFDGIPRYGEVDVSEYSKKEVMLALYQRANVLGFGFFSHVADDKELKVVMSDINNMFEFQKRSGCVYFDYLNGKPMKVGVYPKTGFLFGAYNYEHRNSPGDFKKAVQDLKPVADQEFKKCSLNPVTRLTQYNAQNYQSTPEGRKKLADLFDEGADICRGGYRARIKELFAK